MTVIDEIKSRLDIVEIVSSHVPSLKKAGRTYKGLCPFHSEKTPSFVVFPATQSWHCFGACGTGGDIFGFVMRQQGYDFKEALKHLANKAGVVLQEQSPETIEANQARQKLLDILAAAATFYHENLLKTPHAQLARDYLINRQLSPEIVHRFQLGYAPNQWESLKYYLADRGYVETDLVATGLLVVRDDGSPGYDRFRHRLMIPIRNIQGEVIGFGARVLDSEQQPKYLNSPQSSLFDKSATLYGLDVAKHAIRQHNQAVIVEGYMDVLQAHEHGFTNVISSMGTALTEQQLKLLKRYTDQFVLALDADNAGSAATLRGLNVARDTLGKELMPVPTATGLIRYEGRLNTDIRIVSLPAGKDPDDVLKEDEQSWPNLIETASPLMDYYIQAITANLDLETAKGKSTAVRELIPILREVSSPIEQTHYLQQLARLVRIDERTLKVELDRVEQPKRYQQKPQVTQPQPQTGKTDVVSSTGLEETCLAMLIGQPSALHQVNQTLYQNEVDVFAVSDFSKPENGALFLTVKAWAITENPTLDALLTQVDEHLEGHLASLLAVWHGRTQPLEYVIKELPKIILRIRKKHLKQKIQDINLMQKDAQEDNNQEELLQCKILISETSRTLQKLDKARDALSITGRRRFEERYLG